MKTSNLFFDLSVDRDNLYLPGDQLAAGGQRLFEGVFQPAAAGDLHPDQGDALDMVRF